MSQSQHTLLEVLHDPIFLKIVKFAQRFERLKLKQIF